MGHLGKLLSVGLILGRAAIVVAFVVGLLLLRRLRLHRQISKAVADHLAFASQHPVQFQPHHEILTIRQRVERMRGRSVSGIDQKIREALNKARA